jgi:hypothetical protein
MLASKLTLAPSYFMLPRSHQQHQQPHQRQEAAELQWLQQQKVGVDSATLRLKTLTPAPRHFLSTLF